MSYQQYFWAPRASQSLCNEGCQNILYKTAFEHFEKIQSFVAFLAASKSFRNSSFGANFLANFIVDEHTIRFLSTVLTPSSCFSLQLVPSLRIENSNVPEQFDDQISHFVADLAETKYLPLQLRFLTVKCANNKIPNSLFGSSVSFSQLRSISFDGCVRVDNITLALMSDSAPHVTNVDLGGCKMITDAGLQHLSKLADITFLNLAHCNLITNAGHYHVSKLSKITGLYLAECAHITDVGLQHISELSNIITLDLESCYQIRDAGLEHISKLSHITSLNLRSCLYITDSGVEHLTKLTNITYLSLASCIGVSDAGMEHVAKLSNIVVLSLENCDQLTDAGLEHLFKLSRMKTLNLVWGGEFTEDCISKFEEALPNCKMQF